VSKDKLKISLEIASSRFPILSVVLPGLLHTLVHGSALAIVALTELNTNAILAVTAVITPFIFAGVSCCLWIFRRIGALRGAEGDLQGLRILIVFGMIYSPLLVAIAAIFQGLGFTVSFSGVILPIIPATISFGVATMVMLSGGQPSGAALKP
jgi:hypothetical protein